MKIFLDEIIFEILNKKGLKYKNRSAVCHSFTKKQSLAPRGSERPKSCGFV
jgi:hypothetical protein